MTKPTRLQEQACDQLADALLLITSAARHDGKAAFGKADLEALSAVMARASSAFALEQIVARALEKRGRSLGLRAGTAELLTLMDSEIAPLAMLLLPDDPFREQVEIVDRELGEV